MPKILENLKLPQVHQQIHYRLPVSAQFNIDRWIWIVRLDPKTTVQHLPLLNYFRLFQFTSYISTN